MNFTYFNEEDLLYQIENYKFRLKNSPVADIKLLIFFNGDNVYNNYSYEAEITDSKVPIEYKSVSATDNSLKTEIGAELTGIFKTKEDALQDAINTISKLMDHYTKNT